MNNNNNTGLVQRGEHVEQTAPPPPPRPSTPRTARRDQTDLRLCLRCLQVEKSRCGSHCTPLAKVIKKIQLDSQAKPFQIQTDANDNSDFFVVVVVIIISHIGDWRHGFCFYILSPPPSPFNELTKPSQPFSCSKLVCSRNPCRRSDLIR